VLPLKNLKDKIRFYRETLSVLQQELRSRTHGPYITCDHCGKRKLLSNCVLFQHKWYIQPSGCMDGDYWRTSEDRGFYCEHCNDITTFGKGSKVANNAHDAHYTIVYIDRGKGIIVRREHFREMLEEYNENPMR